MAFRTKVRKYYVTRREDGTIKKWTPIGKSLAADRRRNGRAISTSRRGQGNQGDYINPLRRFPRY